MSTALLLVAWSNIFWGFLSVVVFVLSILLTLIILIQDSKDTGLTSAFGGAGGGNALLGARMQKDLAKLTAIFGAVLAVCLIIMGLMTTSMRHGSVGSAGAALPAAEKVEGGSGEATKPLELPELPELPGGQTTPSATTPSATTPSATTPSAPAPGAGTPSTGAPAEAGTPAGATGQPASAAPATDAPKVPAVPTESK